MPTKSGCKATVIILTGHGPIPTAISAIKLGAYEFIGKPFLPEDLVNVIRDASALKDQRIHVHDSIVSYIQKYAIQIHRREEVANHFDISPDTVSNRIRQIANQAFRDFLHTCRLHTARRLLTETTIDIATITQHSGFCTTSHFSRIFCLLEQMSPTQ